MVVVGWNDTTSTVQSVKDSAGNTYSLAIGPTTGTALRQSIYYAPNIKAGQQHGDGDVQSGGSVSGRAHSGVPGSDDGGCDGGSEREWNGGEQWSGDDTSANELIFGANMVSTGNGAAGSGFTTRIITVAGRGHGGRQGGDDDGEQQCDRDVDVLRSLGHADGNVQIKATCRASCFQVCDS